MRSVCRVAMIFSLCFTFLGLACVESNRTEKVERGRVTLFESADDNVRSDRIVQDWSEHYIKTDRGIRKHRFVVLNRAALSVLKDTGEKRLTLNLFHDVTLSFLIDSREKHRPAKGIEVSGDVFNWEGKGESEPENSFSMTCVGDRVEAEIRTAKSIYEIRPGPEESKIPLLHIVTEVQDVDLRPCESHRLEEPKKKAPVAPREKKKLDSKDRQK